MFYKNTLDHQIMTLYDVIYTSITAKSNTKCITNFECKRYYLTKSLLNKVKFQVIHSDYQLVRKCITR